MIKAVFYCFADGFVKSFSIRGHANYSIYGQDIVCAGVSSAVSMCCNGILEFRKKKVEISYSEGLVELEAKNKDVVVQCFLIALKNQITTLQKEYSRNINLKIVEV